MRWIIQCDGIDYRACLNKELEARKLRNARYSMRAFARDLGVSASYLNEVITNKSHFSRDKWEKIAASLNVSGPVIQPDLLSAIQKLERLVKSSGCSISIE